MKKFISLLLSIIMLIGTVLCADFSAYAQINDTISVGETKTVTIENGGDYYYFTFTPEADGNYIFSSNSDTDTCGYLYDSDMNKIASDDNIAEKGINFKIRYDFEAGKTYILGCRYRSSRNTGSFDVSLIENRVAGISYTPVNPIEYFENTDGWWGTYNNERYYCYSTPYYKDGDILTVIDKDGNSVDYIFNPYTAKFVSEDGDILNMSFLYYYDEQYSNHWTVGSDNYYTVEYMYATTQVPVTIVENPAVAISFTPSNPIEIIENTNGYWESGDNGERYFRYNIPNYKTGDILTLIDNNGNSVDYIFDSYKWEFISEAGEVLDRDYLYCYDEQDSNHWTLGSDNYYTVNYIEATAQVPVSIVENPVASISFTPVKPIEIIENTNGRWDYDEETGEKFYYYYTPGFTQGDILTVTDNDGNSIDYTYGYYDDYDDGCFLSENGDVIYAGNLNRYDNQYSTPWTLGGDNYYTVEYMGATAQVNVSIVQCEHKYLAEIHQPTCINDGYTHYYCENCGDSYDTDYTTATGVHTYVNGCCKYCHTRDENYTFPTISSGETKTVNIENGGDYYYFTFTPQSSGNYVFSSNSNEDTYGYLYDSDMNEIVSDDDSGVNTNFSIRYDFEAGITYIFSCRYYSSSMTGSFDVSLIENRVAGISYTPVNPIEIVENTNGRWEYDEETGEEFYYYDIPWFSQGDVLTVTDNDGNSIDYTYGYYEDYYNYCFLSENGDVIYTDNLDIYSNQYSTPWTLGSDNYYTIEYLSATTQVNVSIVENPVASISFTPVKPIEIIENTNGEYYYDGDVDSRFYHYYLPNFSQGDVLTVTDNDGNSVDYTYNNDDGYFLSENGDVIFKSNLRRSSDQYSKHWTLGSDNYYTIEYMGAATQVPVTIAESPVASVSFTPVNPIEIIENTRGYTCENGWYYYAPEFNDGDIIVVNYKDGTQDSFVYKDWRFLNSNGIRLRVDSYDFEYSGFGEAEFKIDLYEYGFSTYAPVTIVENPVDSIEYNSVEGFNNIEGITYTGHGGEESTFRDGYIKNGDTLTIHYKSGAVEEYEAVLDECGIYHFVNADGNELNSNANFHIENHYDDEYRNVVSVDIICYGCKLNFPIASNIYISSISFEPANPVTIIESNGLEESRNTWINEEGNVCYSPDVYWGQDENGKTLIKSEIFNTGDVINVTFSDGRTARYTYKANRSYEFGYGFIGDDNSVLYVGNIRSNQNEQPWIVGGDNYFTINYSQASTDRIPVTIVPASEHIHSYSAVITEPTSDSRGYTTYTCECGDSYVDNYTDFASDNSVLLAVLEQIESYSNDDFSASTLESLRNIYDSYSSMASDSYSQSDIDKAISDLLTAISALEPYLNLDISAPNGTFTVSYNGETNSNNSNSLLLGTNVTVSATANEGYEFVGWYDTVNNLYFSKNTEYSFNITTNTSLTAVFVAEQSATLTFTTYSNWVQSTVTKTIDEWNTVESIDELLPVVPYRYGYSNGRWVYDNAEVLAKLQAGENVSLIPEYDKDDTSLPTPPLPDGDTPVLDLYYSLDTGANVGSFVMAAGIPENCQIESVGIAFYYKDAKEFDPTKFELLINNKMLTGRFNTDEIDDIYIINLNNMTARYNFAARGYVTYYNTDGVLKTVYSNQVNIVNREQV